jgi:hypothetical protein
MNHSIFYFKLWCVQKNPQAALSHNNDIVSSDGGMGQDPSQRAEVYLEC